MVFCICFCTFVVCVSFVTCFLSYLVRAYDDDYYVTKSELNKTLINFNREDS